MLMTRRASCIPVFIWMMLEKTRAADDSKDKCYQRNGMEMRELDENWTVSGDRWVCVPEFSIGGLTGKGFRRSFYAQFEPDAPEECKIKKKSTSAEY